MGNYEQREMGGALFKNKKGKDAHPDMRGAAKIRGVLYEIAAWAKETKNGSRFLSMVFSVPDEQQQPEPGPRDEPQPEPENRGRYDPNADNPDDDNLPF